MCIALPAEITGDYILPLGGRDVQHQYGNRIKPKTKKENVSNLKNKPFTHVKPIPVYVTLSKHISEDNCLILITEY